MADEEPETFTDLLNDVYGLFPNNGTRQKLRWIVNRLIRLTKSNPQTITSILEQSQTINSEILCSIIIATWTTEYNFQTTEEIQIHGKEEDASCSPNTFQSAVSSIVSSGTIGNESCMAFRNQPITATKSKEADELENIQATQEEKSKLEADAKSTKTDDLNLSSSNGNQDETLNTKTTTVKVAATKIYTSSSNSSSTSSSSSNSSDSESESDSSDTPVGGNSDLSEDENEAISSDSEKEEALKSKAINSPSTPNNENKSRNKALQAVIPSPYSPPRKRLKSSVEKKIQIHCISPVPESSSSESSGNESSGDKSKFKCKLCNKVYRTLRTFKMHQNSVHNPMWGGYLCRKNCGMRFRSFQERAKHEKGSCRATNS